MTSSLVFVGSYKDAQSDSISVLRLDTASAELTFVKGFQGGENPSYLIFDQQREFLYAVNEIDRDNGQTIGAVCAFSVDQQTGDLTLLNRVSAHGELPVSLALSEDETALLVANYSAGNAVVVPVRKDHALEQATDVQQHNELQLAQFEQRQAHAHHVCFSPDDRFVFIVDLGLDRIVRYQLDSAHRALHPTADPVAFETRTDAGPRHMTFHPNGQYAYLIHERKSFVTVLAYHPETGTFLEKQTISTIPSDFTGNNQCGGIKISHDGKYVFGSNRGHNSIVMYATKQNGGHLEHLQTIDSGGDWPREFTTDLTDNILLVANQCSNNIVSFRIDPQNPRPLRQLHQIELERPVFLQVVPPFG